jgi:replicative DNA helicase
MSAPNVVEFPSISSLANVEAEQQILGAIMANNGILQRLSPFLDAHHFADERHAMLYRSCLSLVERGSTADPITLSRFVRSSGMLEAVGGNAYLARLVSAVLSVSSAVDYGKLIVDLWRRRAALEGMRLAADRLIRDDLDDPSGKILDEIAADLSTIATVGSATNLVSAGAAAMSAIETVERKQRGEIVTTKTGFRDLDRRLGGLLPSRLYLLAGRPSMGKTAAGQWIAFNVARAGVPVLIVSLEMTADELSMRWLAGLTGIDLERINSGDIDANEQSRLVAAKVDLDALPITIEDRAGLTVQEISGIARKVFRGAKRALLIIDHLGLVDVPAREGAGRVEKTTDLSNSLKRLAKTLRHPVLALAQLSRANEQREDKRPQLSDLGWSGALEQDADVVIFTHRESYYLERAKPSRRPRQTQAEADIDLSDWLAQCEAARGRAELSIAKNRNGSIGIIGVAFEERVARFSDLARDDA